MDLIKSYLRDNKYWVYYIIYCILINDPLWYESYKKYTVFNFIDCLTRFEI